MELIKFNPSNCAQNLYIKTRHKASALPINSS